MSKGQFIAIPYDEWIGRYGYASVPPDAVYNEVSFEVLVRVADANKYAAIQKWIREGKLTEDRWLGDWDQEGKRVKHVRWTVGSESWQCDGRNMVPDDDIFSRMALAVAAGQGDK